MSKGGPWGNGVVRQERFKGEGWKPSTRVSVGTTEVSRTDHALLSFLVRDSG